MSLVKLLKKKKRKILFTTPSHNQNFAIYKPIKRLYLYDISETETYNPQEALKKAQEYVARKIYKTNSTYFLTNGSTSGVIASVLACVEKGDKVLLNKDAHKCHLNAVKLAGAEPVFYDVSIDEEWGVPLDTDPNVIEEFLSENEGIKAVIVTSPTYEGIVSDIKAIKKVCKKYGAYLIVDEAHGALYPFSDRLPESAINQADFVIQSLHKTAGGLNPTALLHCCCDLDVTPALEMINTTSPSYPLLASIEENINYLNSWIFKRRLDKMLDEIELLEDECINCEFYGDDITKILVKISNKTGYELSDILYRYYGIEDEKTNEKSTMLLCGVGTDRKNIKKLKDALKVL